ncbi:hypothetical protein BGZ65_003764 [Modicella reniformis]|uniref:DUF202 domain-containing protein n=1 Tax=Modicella reniformis TaxID=1440133 RepID=A0A9P6ILI8_9FUNG|nr:hypothetical protein BGZ65_003764 [Modicella reniformis]
MQDSRSLTPQPWHPDYSRSTSPNPLDLPEHRRNGSRESGGLEEVDLGNKREKNGKSNDDEDKDEDVPVLNKTRKNIFSRLGRSRTKKRYKYESTGKLAQFSNERLFLHWIRFGILQGSIAILLLSYGIGLAAYIGVGALLLALATLIYGTTLYHLRHLYMVAKRDDIVYYAKVVPTLLTFSLIGLYGVNFALTLSMGDTARSPPPWKENDFHFG